MDAEMTNVPDEKLRITKREAFRTRISKIAKSPLFLVLLTWMVMAFLLAFEVAAKK